MKADLVRRGELLVEGVDEIRDARGRDVPAPFVVIAAGACDLYRVTLALWRQPGSRRPASTRTEYLHQLSLADQLVSISTRAYLVSGDSAEYAYRVWRAFHETSGLAARLLAELSVTGESPPEIPADRGARMLAPGWEAIVEPLRTLTPASVPTPRAELEQTLLGVARSYEGWMKSLGFSYVSTADGGIEFAALDPARWTRTPLAPPLDDPPAAEVPLRWLFSTLSTARDHAMRDGRFDPMFIDGSIRRLIRAWRAAGLGEAGVLASLAVESVVAEAIEPHAEERDARIRLHDVRWRDIAISAIYPNSLYPNAEPQMSVFVDAEARDDRPPPLVSGYVPRPLGFTLFWTLGCDEPDPGVWRLRRAHATTDEGLASTPYILRRETVEEFRERLGAPALTPVAPRPRTGPPYRYQISCDYAEHDLRIGGSAVRTIEADTAPTRAEAELLITPAVLDDLRQRTQEQDLRPSINTLQTRELLDGD
ncbi:MAG: hypothetical protein ACLP01_26055 [Solirubrobacteraceae bacterium]